MAEAAAADGFLELLPPLTTPPPLVVPEVVVVAAAAVAAVVEVFIPPPFVVILYIYSVRPKKGWNESLCVMNGLGIVVVLLCVAPLRTTCEDIALLSQSTDDKP